MTESTYFESVRDALADTPEEAANLRLRAELMDEIVCLYSPKRSAWLPRRTKVRASSD